MPHSVRMRLTILAIIVLSVPTVLVGTAAAQPCEPQCSVELQGPCNATVVALCVEGDSTGPFAGTGHGLAQGTVALAVRGSARGAVAVALLPGSPCSAEGTLVAVGGMCEAEGGVAAVSGTEDSNADVAAASGTGDAEAGVVSVDTKDGVEFGDDADVFPVCHAPPGDPDDRHTIFVGPGAVAAHLRNHPDDHPGPCVPGE